MTTQFSTDQSIYAETQRLHHNAIVRYVVPISCLFSVALAGAVMLSQGASGVDLAVLLAIGLGVPLLLAMLPMHVSVGEDAVRVRSLFVFSRTIDVAKITEAQAVRYNPLTDCGGWGGARPSRKYGVVFNMTGDRGVHVRYGADGAEKSVLLGSRRSEELERAIRLAADLPDAAPAHVVAPA